MPKNDPYKRNWRGQPVVWVTCIDASAMADYSWKTKYVLNNNKYVLKRRLVYDGRGIYTKYGKPVWEPHIYTRAALLGADGTVEQTKDPEARRYLDSISSPSKVATMPHVYNKSDDFDQDDADSILD